MSGLFLLFGEVLNLFFTGSAFDIQSVLTPQKSPPIAAGSWEMNLSINHHPQFLGPWRAPAFDWQPGLHNPSPGLLVTRRALWAGCVLHSLLL